MFERCNISLFASFVHRIHAVTSRQCVAHNLVNKLQLIQFDDGFWLPVNRTQFTLAQRKHTQRTRNKSEKNWNQASWFCAQAEEKNETYIYRLE